eukprot:COSAG06_NODE_11230_length_1541_cov_1.628294_1_plen_55_part_10
MTPPIEFTISFDITPIEAYNDGYTSIVDFTETDDIDYTIDGGRVPGVFFYPGETR